MSESPDALRIDPDERRATARRPGHARLFAGALLVGVVAAAATWWWLQPAPEAPPASSGVEPPPAAAPSQAGPRPPVDPTAGEPPLAAADLEPALAQLLGDPAANALLHTDGFARRVVATIDNLGRSYAPASLWPVAPAPGRFQVAAGPDGPVIAPSNAARYDRLVRLADGLDPAATIRLYRRLHPLLQAAYGELGFPGQPLNDRVVEVIDLLLATPEPAAPPRVQLTEVKGPVPGQRPWVRYEFADAWLEGLAAGQKILVRVGPDHARVLKRKLAALRQALLAPPTEAAAR